MLDILKTAVYSGYADALFMAIETGNRHEATQIMLDAVGAYEECQIDEDQLACLYKDYDAYLNTFA